jgi:hypothetical protein
VPTGRARFGDSSTVYDSDVYDLVSTVEGESPVEWRQGVKHDAAKVMVLSRGGREGGWVNGLGESVDTETERVFPLLRGGALQNRTWPPEQAVILPQSIIGEPTDQLRVTHPRLWRYLEAHAEILDARKSSIYRTQPRFSVFGIGPYTFSGYKVAVASLYRKPTALAIGPWDSKAVVLDDTCYLLPTGSDGELARVVAALLNHDSARSFLGSISNRSSKRTLSKKVLRRLDWQAVADHIDWADVEELLEDSVLGDLPDVRTEDLPLGAWVKERLAEETRQATLF